MKRALLSLFAALSVFAPLQASAASAEDEATFIQSYKSAFEASDGNALAALLHEGAPPMVLEFYQMMMTAEFGATVTSIGLEDLSPEDVVKADEVQQGPDGSNLKLAPKPYKKLVIRLARKTAEQESISTSEVFVAEKDGKLGISVPVPAQ
jgi:hypothetical protein